MHSPISSPFHRHLQRMVHNLISSPVHRHLQRMVHDLIAGLRCPAARTSDIFSINSVTLVDIDSKGGTEESLVIC
ncbi:hypothetical protein LSAT2_028783 [Lamellibrachia satsuma]|nr:hypothetical protein LSAT2_028783 [Lamellibrachia satsuma]